VIYYHTLANVSDLALGGLAAYSVVNFKLNEKIEKLSKAWILFIYVIGITSLVAATKIFPGELRSIERLIQGSFFAFVVLEQVYCVNSLFKMDRLPGFAKAGQLTYGFYMYHCIYIYYWGIYFKNNGFTEHFWQFLIYFILIFICTYITSVLSMKFFERPILNLKNRFR
jgi:peptidoglycan/LPS O-acetylase OafA/YrhL